MHAEAARYMIKISDLAALSFYNFLLSAEKYVYLVMTVPTFSLITSAVLSSEVIIALPFGTASR